MRNVALSINLSPKQKEVLGGAKRFTMWRAGRQTGKTYAGEYWFIKRALTKPNSVNWYVAQDTSTTKELNIPLFEKFVPRELIKDYSKSEKCFTLYNGARCYFKTAGSSDNMRGRSIDTLLAEEPPFWQNGFSIYHDILRPQLITTNGYVMLIGSPPTKKAPIGAEWFRRLENVFLQEIKEKNPDYAFFHSTIFDNPFVSDKEKELLQKTSEPLTWATEYLGNYVDSIGQVYWEYDPLTKTTITDENIIMRVRGLDFGIADNTACAWINLLPNNRVYISDEYIANNLDVPAHARAIKEKTIAPAQWTILDSACWARDASLTSVAKRFAAEGIACTQGTKDLDGSVSDMKLMFANGNIIINPACTGLLRAIDSWQHGQHEPDILAATRYGIDALMRSGKLMRPVRTDRPKTIQERWQEMEQLDKRTRELNAQFFSSRPKEVRAFRIVK